MGSGWPCIAPSAPPSASLLPFLKTKPVRSASGVAVVAVILRRRARARRRHFKTPHNWLMFLYGGYIIFTASDLNNALAGFLPLAVFYWVTLEALDSERRIGTYLRWWLAMLMAVAGLGVMSLFGLDLTGAVELTEAFKGRLAIGTWIHGNPNSLAHTVIVALPVCYFLMVWRNGLVRRLQALPLLLVAAYCVYCAQSRGAFVAGILLVAFALVLGRGIILQGFVTLFLVSSATALLSNLPRMDEDLRSDEGVQGRIMAWEIARTASRREFTGEGWKEFEAYISYEGESVKKATHSCYVRVAADLDRDVAAQKEFLAGVADHPVGDFHGFMGFDTLRELEEEFLPSEELLAKYAGSVGYQPPSAAE